MALLTRGQINDADDRPYEDVPVPEWGGEVRIRGMSGTERDAYQNSMVSIGPSGKVQRISLQDALAKLLVRCIVNENNERIYGDKDTAELGAKNAEILERLRDVAKRLSGLGKEELEAAEGNSDAGQSGDSSSA